MMYHFLKLKKWLKFEYADHLQIHNNQGGISWQAY